jgi:hypothetical protein
MGRKGKEFLSKLDELIFLFAKLREKAANEGVILQKDPLYQNFELLTRNYQLIKNNIPEGLIEEMGAPMIEIISQMVDQLKKDLGVEVNNKKVDLKQELEDIDALLKNQKLSENDINNLLDKRASINKEL